MMRASATTLAVSLVAAGAIVAMTVAAPDAQRRRNDNGAFGAPVATNTVVDDPGSYYGKTITVTASVEAMVSPTAFVLDQKKMVSATQVQSMGKPLLVIAPYLTATLEPSKYMLVTGQLIKFTPGAVEKLVGEYTLDLPADTLTKYTDQPVLVATSILDGMYTEYGKKPLPPPSPQEIAMTTAMKSIGSASQALRTATQDGKADVVGENVALLRSAFTTTEEIWDALGQVPAAQLARDGRAKAIEAGAAAAAGNWDEAKAATAAMNQVCGACHNAYRDRMDDGTFRFRPGSF